MATVTPLRAPAPSLGKVSIRVDRVYGIVKIYPVCDRAKAFARIAGTKTLSLEDLGEITAMGFHLELAGGIELLNEGINKLLRAEAAKP